MTRSQLTLSQRWVFVIAFGVVMWLLAGMTLNLTGNGGADAGWFNYEPNDGVHRYPDDSLVVRRAIVWLVALGMWLLVSLRLLRAPTTE